MIARIHRCSKTSDSKGGLKNSRCEEIVHLGFSLTCDVEDGLFADELLRGLCGCRVLIAENACNIMWEGVEREREREREREKRECVRKSECVSV